MQKPASDALKILVLLLSLTHGLLFICTTPLWEGFDEPFHYGYIQHLAEYGRLPVFGETAVSEEVRISFENAPLSRVVNSNFRNQYTTFERYWELSGADRLQRERNLRLIPAEAKY